MNTEAFAKAWLGGKVCLHPTDTLPGLSFHPELKSAEEDFMAIKERPDDKRPISLIADRALTNRYWQTLPPLWDKALQKLWPSSLSVIWLASDACPKSLVAIDGTTAFRLPQWTQDKLWMRDLLLKVNLPFPSSSVNRSGETAEVSWAGAVAFCAHAPREVIVPEW
ncbi:MAG: Sua5/YciO/YrdC/YwlC family protein, partial [Bdellovibrionota bacterium]